MRPILILLAWTASAASAESNLAEAVTNILLKSYQDPFAPVLISQAATSIEHYRSQQDLLNAILTRLGGKIAIRFNVPSKNALRRPWTNHLFCIDSFTAFQRIYTKLNVDEYDFSGKYLVVHTNQPDHPMILQVFEHLFKLQIINVVFAAVFERSVELWTYVPFAPGRCLALNLIMLPSDVEQVHDFFPDKTTTFHGCTFRVGAFETRPFTFLQYLPSQQLVLSGIEGDLLATLMEKLDFRVVLFTPPNDAQWGYAIKHNSTGLMRMIEEGEVEFGLSCLGISTARSEIMKPGVAHYTTALVIAIPPGRPYSVFEKLFRPFQWNVWFGIILVTAVGIVTIAAIERSGAVTRDFVYGRRVRNPYLNMVRIFFGIGMHVVPSRNFARTLLIAWMYLSFILRILYQGSSFKHLQMSSSRPPSQTLADVDATDAHYHVIDVGARYYEAFPHRMARLRFMPSVKDSIAAQLLWMSQHPTDPDVAQGCLDHVAYHNRVHRGRPGGFVHVAKEIIATFTAAIYYPKQSMLTAQFDRQIQWIQAAGLVNYWVEQYGDYDFSERHDGTDGPQPMTLGQLLGAFQLGACLLAFAGFVFLGEVLSAKLRVTWKVIELF